MRFNVGEILRVINPDSPFYGWKLQELRGYATEFKRRTADMRSITAQGQQPVVDDLVKRFSIDGTKVLFLNPSNPLEPWLNAEALTAIARQTGEFRGFSEDYSTYIEPLKQLVHVATVTDLAGRIYTRSGAATLGERLPNQEVADEHGLASSRALHAALTAAGFNPVKAASVVALDLSLPAAGRREQDQAASMLEDTKLIHTIAAQKGLIHPFAEDPSSGRDYSDYRRFLSENYGGITTVVGMKPAERAALINVLRNLPDVADGFQQARVA